MIAASNTDEIAKQLEEYSKEVERKLRNMVKSFVYEVTVKVIDNTPYGDSEKYSYFYNIPTRLQFLPATEGTAKGGWFVGINEDYSMSFPSQASSKEADEIKYRAKAGTTYYKLGDTVYIANSVPYVANSGWTWRQFGALEDGYSDQAPNGIMKPTIADVQNSIESDLKRYYDEG